MKLRLTVKNPICLAFLFAVQTVFPAKTQLPIINARELILKLLIANNHVR
jgi:hypothetical protein